MSKLKRLATKQDAIVSVECPISHSELDSRSKDYPLLRPMDFAKKYSDMDLLFRPIVIRYKGKELVIQMNGCINPYCKWFGKEQERFVSVKHKPYRYKFSGPEHNKSIICNPDPFNPYDSEWGCSTLPLSNWSIADEIARFATIDTIQDWEPSYKFHRESCVNDELTPFTNPDGFYRRGKSSSSSQKWQCKTCKKITNVLPKQRESFSYHQKRNDVLPLLARHLLGRVPVKRSCEILEMSPNTYYQKLEWLYRKCLEFLARHEKQAFETKVFKRILLDTDDLHYNLNNIKKRGYGGGKSKDKPHLQTHVMVSADAISKYVFRADVAYDSNITLDDIDMDTRKYMDDHLYFFGRKHARLRYSYSPQPPSDNDTQSLADYLSEKQEYDLRKNYTDGLHVQTTYTAIAHYWLVKQMINTKYWSIISDKSQSLINAASHVFAEEIKNANAHHFLCLVDREKSKEDAYTEYVKSRKALTKWGLAQGYSPSDSISKVAYAKLLEDLCFHQFHTTVGSYKKWANKPIEHPIATVDKGIYEVDCRTDVSRYTPGQLASMLLPINNHATNGFMQQIRRRISILERPLVTARGDGKSYIYANFNPKYAQFAVTILRTYFNFCFEIKDYNGVKATPAIHLGIADRKYSLEDIIYFK